MGNPKDIMLNKKRLACIGILFFLSFPCTFSYAQTDGFGQTIQINTRFKSYLGKPVWLFIIRDIDHNQNIPYVFEINNGNNYWVAFTYGRNYVIEASNLQIEVYQPKYNTYKNYRISNFCHLESNGRIMKGESMTITITGKLTPNSNSYSCHVTSYPVNDFVVATPPQ